MHENNKRTEGDVKSINCTDCCVQLDIMEARAGTQPDDNNQSEESALALKEKCIR